MSTLKIFKSWIWYLRVIYTHTHTHTHTHTRVLLAASCVLISEDDLPYKFYIKLIKWMAQENNYHDREYTFLMIWQGPVSYLCFWRILKVRLKIFQLFCLPDCNSEGDKIDSNLWLSVSVLFCGTCWLAAVGDYCRFLCQE
jgi:hypothetical protein